MADKERDLSEELFKAIQTITDKSLEGLKYDKTILCSITNADNAAIGQYTVSDGTVEFTAYSDNIGYKVRNNVYVTIPQGDYNNRRIIIGKYKAENDTPYVYVAPTENYINITNNIFNNNDIIENNGLLANGEIKSYKIWESHNIIYSNYDRLGIKADFMSLLNDFNTSEGTYGLILKVICNEARTAPYASQLWADEDNDNELDEDEVLVDDNGQELTTDEDNTILQDYYLTLLTSDMFGNPYAFVGNTAQEKVFDISQMPPIQDMELYFVQYQDFKDNQGNDIPTQSTSNLGFKEVLPNNIFVNNIDISFGYDLERFDDNTILLYTLSSKTYSSTSENNIKNIQMRLIKNINDIFYSFDEDDDLDLLEEINTSCIIHWYRWELDANINDVLAGAFWQEITPDNNFYTNYIPGVQLQNERIKVGIEFITKNINQEDVIEYYESNIVQLENERQVPNPATVDLIRGLQLYTDDGYNGVYALYGENNNLMNEYDSKIERHLIATYESLITGTNLDGKETVTWKIPSNNTLIENVSFPIEMQDLGIDDNGYHCWTGAIPELKDKAGIGQTNIYEAFLTYTIAQTYSQLATNNTIYCIIEKNKLNYQAELTMTFTTAGTNGTDYTLVFEISDVNTGNNIIKNALGYQPSAELKVRAQLRDYDNKPLDNNSWRIGWYGNTDIDISSDIAIESISNEKNDNFNYYKIINYTNNNYNNLILYITTTYNGIDLTSYLPIPRCIEGYEQYAIEGPNKVIYDSGGSNPVFTRKPYNLYFQNKLIQNLRWEIQPQEIGYATLNSNNELIPPIIHLKQLYKISYVLCYTENNTCIWAQPILMIDNRFGSSMLNKWDGSLTIDINQNQILASTIAAGRKDSDNKFSGVLLGEVGKNSDLNNIITGLMGYDTGIRTFLLNSNNGNLILGAAGKGQIEMDGSSGVITSGAYNANNQNGMQINLETGRIDAYNFKLESNKVVIDSSENSNNYLKIRTAKNGNILMLVGENQYYLQSKDFDEDAHTGFKIDLRSQSDSQQNNGDGHGGRIIGYNTELKFYQNKTQELFNAIKELKLTLNEGTTNQRELTDSEINQFINGTLTDSWLQRNGISDDEISSLHTLKDNQTNRYMFLSSNDTQSPIKIGSKFRVNWDGSIKAAGGTIGGWKIDAEKLTSNSGTVGMAKYIAEGDHPIFWSGNNAFNNANWKSDVGFGVSKSGELFANKGRIGNWQIDNGSLVGGAAGKFITLAPSQITLGDYSSFTADEKAGTIQYNGATGRASISASGVFIGQKFIGSLEGIADNAKYAWNAGSLNGKTSDNFATAADLAALSSTIDDLSTTIDTLQSSLNTVTDFCAYTIPKTYSKIGHSHEYAPASHTHWVEKAPGVAY